VFSSGSYLILSSIRPRDGASNCELFCRASVNWKSQAITCTSEGVATVAQRPDGLPERRIWTAKARFT
jgi:hypothetical protein